MSGWYFGRAMPPIRRRAIIILHDQHIIDSIVELERCLEPASSEEQELVSEISALTFYQVARVSEERMAEMRMLPQTCHNNAAAYAALDRSNNSKPVSGWWRRGDVFLFHSVVLSQSRLQCVTPNGLSGMLEFAPDPAIEWVDINGMKVARRNGQRVPYLVRVHPEETMAAAREALAALHSDQQEADTRDHR